MCITFPFKISQAIEKDECIIIRLEPDVGKVLNQNVYCITLDDGTLKWKIEESPHGTQTDKPYTRIFLSGNSLIAGNWNGIDYKVDFSNGKVTAYSNAK